MCLFTIPLYFQLARGATAAQSGLYLAPFMLSNAAGNVAGSRYARRFGTTARGNARCQLAVLRWTGSAGRSCRFDAPVWAIIVAMVITGPGIGGCFIGSMMGGQNALGAKDIGSGTGALLVLRSVGGASGSSLAGAIIASGLIAVQQTSSATGPTAAQSMHRGAAALADAVREGQPGCGGSSRLEFRVGVCGRRGGRRCHLWRDAVDAECQASRSAAGRGPDLRVAVAPRGDRSVVEFLAAGAGFTMVSPLSSEAEAGSNPGRALQTMGRVLWRLRFRPGPGTCWRAARTGLRTETMGTVSCRHRLRRSTRPGRWRLDGVVRFQAQPIFAASN